MTGEGADPVLDPLLFVRNERVRIGRRRWVQLGIAAMRSKVQPVLVERPRIVEAEDEMVDRKWGCSDSDGARFVAHFALCAGSSNRRGVGCRDAPERGLARLRG